MPWHPYDGLQITAHTTPSSAVSAAPCPNAHIRGLRGSPREVGQPGLLGPPGGAQAVRDPRAVLRTAPVHLGRPGGPPEGLLPHCRPPSLEAIGGTAINDDAQVREADKLEAAFPGALGPEHCTLGRTPSEKKPHS